MSHVLEHLIASDNIQEALPDLGSQRMVMQFAEYNQRVPLVYARNEDDVKQRLISVGIAVDNHERFADIWEREVSSRVSAMFHD
jgi:hypothetical protein